MADADLEKVLFLAELILFVVVFDENSKEDGCSTSCTVCGVDFCIGRNNDDEKEVPNVFILQYFTANSGIFPKSKISKEQPIA